MVDGARAFLTSVKHSAEICHGNKQMFLHNSLLMDNKMSCDDVCSSLNTSRVRTVLMYLNPFTIRRDILSILTNSNCFFETKDVKRWINSLPHMVLSLIHRTIILIEGIKP